MNVTLVCPEYVSGQCLERGCDGRLARPQYEGMSEDGADLYSGSCPRGWQMFRGIRAAVCDETHPDDVRAISGVRTHETRGRATSHGKGVCEFSGREVHPKIFIERGESVTVRGKVYRFTGASSWGVANAFFRSIAKGDDHSQGCFPVAFTTADNNRAKGDFAAFVKDLIERQPAACKERNRRFEPRARFRIERL